MASIPIWKDYFVTIGTASQYYFRIRQNSTTIYQGIAHKKPGATNVVVKINDICADYMAMIAPTIPYANNVSASFPMQFKTQSSTNGSTWTDKSTVEFDWDWSYKDGVNLSTDGMSYPITGRITRNMMLYQTRYATGSLNATGYYGDGSTTQTIAATTSRPTFNGAMGDLLRHTGKTTAWFDISSYATYSSKQLIRIVMGGVTYDVTKNCPRYVLYYLNPFGGVDHLLIEGNAARNRAVARDRFVADYDNSEPCREEFNYMNEITESYTLNTGLLTDDESSRMPYLLESPQVFLVDLSVSATTFIPVEINTDSYRVQSYRSNGMQMVNYTFDVKVSQNEYKR